MLEDAYGNTFRLSDLKVPSGTLVMFICNHCPPGYDSSIARSASPAA